MTLRPSPILPESARHGGQGNHASAEVGVREDAGQRRPQADESCRNYSQNFAQKRPSLFKMIGELCELWRYDGPWSE